MLKGDKSVSIPNDVMAALMIANSIVTGVLGIALLIASSLNWNPSTRSNMAVKARSPVQEIGHQSQSRSSWNGLILPVGAVLVTVGFIGTIAGITQMLL